MLQRIHVPEPAGPVLPAPEAAVCETSGLRCVLRAVPAVPGDDGVIVVVHVAGDIDLSSQDGLRVALRGGLAAAPRHLVLDLSDVRFCGARALAVLAGAPRGAAGGTTCAVSGLSPVMDRLARCLWDASAPTRYPSLSHALAGIRAA